MNVIKTDIEGVLILEPKVFYDARGYFFESYNERDFNALVGNVNFIQDNESRSQYGVLRGLHFQKGEHSQAKLVRGVRGTVYDVAVDLRKSSPTFGKYVGVELSEENHRQFFIPRGFAHGFAVMSEIAVFQYKCDNLYAPESEGAIMWNDPDLNIKWPVKADKIILSEKDKHHPLLKDSDYLFDYICKIQPLQDCRFHNPNKSATC